MPILNLQSTFIPPAPIPCNKRALVGWLNKPYWKTIQSYPSTNIFSTVYVASKATILWDTKINSAKCNCRFCNHKAISSMPFSSASTWFFIQEPICFFVPFQEQRYFRVLNAGTRSCLPGLQKNLHPFGSYFLDKTLFLLNTNLFMLVKRNKAYSGSLDE